MFGTSGIPSLLRETYKLNTLFEGRPVRGVVCSLLCVSSLWHIYMGNTPFEESI